MSIRFFVIQTGKLNVMERRTKRAFMVLHDAILVTDALVHYYSELNSILHSNTPGATPIHYRSYKTKIDITSIT